MKVQVTYRDLMDLDQDIKTQMQNSAAFVAFNRQKINNFQRENAIRLKLLAKTVNELMETHVTKNDKGHFAQVVKPEGMPNAWAYKSGEDEETFKLKLDEFLTKQIQMVI